MGTTIAIQTLSGDALPTQMLATTLQGAITAAKKPDSAKALQSWVRFVTKEGFSPEDTASLASSLWGRPGTTRRYCDGLFELLTSLQCAELALAVMRGLPLGLLVMEDLGKPKKAWFPWWKMVSSMFADTADGAVAACLRCVMDRLREADRAHRWPRAGDCATTTWFRVKLLQPQALGSQVAFLVARRGHWGLPWDLFRDAGDFAMLAEWFPNHFGADTLKASGTPVDQWVTACRALHMVDFTKVGPRVAEAVRRVCLAMMPTEPEGLVTFAPLALEVTVCCYLWCNRSSPRSDTSFAALSAVLTNCQWCFRHPGGQSMLRAMVPSLLAMASIASDPCKGCGWQCAVTKYCCELLYHWRGPLTPPMARLLLEIAAALTLHDWAYHVGEYVILESLSGLDDVTCTALGLDPLVVFQCQCKFVAWGIRTDRLERRQAFFYVGDVIKFAFKLIAQVPQMLRHREQGQVVPYICSVVNSFSHTFLRLQGSLVWKLHEELTELGKYAAVAWSRPCRVLRPMRLGLQHLCAMCTNTVTPSFVSAQESVFTMHLTALALYHRSPSLPTWNAMVRAAMVRAAMVRAANAFQEAMCMFYRCRSA